MICSLVKNVICTTKPFLIVVLSMPFCLSSHFGLSDLSKTKECLRREFIPVIYALQNIKFSIILCGVFQNVSFH